MNFKNLLPRSLFSRSLLILVLPVFLMQTITTYIFLERHWQHITDRLTEGVVGEISAVVAMMDTEGDQYPVIEIQQAATKMNFEISRKAVENSESFKTFDLHQMEFSFVDVWQSWLLKRLSRSISKNIDYPYDITLNFPQKNIRVDILMAQEVVSFTIPLRRLFSSSAYIFLLWMVGSSCLMLLVAILFMRGQIRPMLRLAVVSERFGKGQDIGAYKASGAREVRQAAHAFLLMRERITRQIEQRTAMLAGISHDLRTPLTRLRLEIEMLPVPINKSEMLQDVAEMEQMIGAYLDFVRGDSDENREVVDINALIQGIVVDWGRLGHPIDFIRHSKEKVSIQAHKIALQRSFSNIINNASKFATKLEIHLKIEEIDSIRFVCLSFEDNGAGIPEEAYEAVFRPFYRLDPSRNKDTGGVGLGLAIAKDGILAHGGEIKLGRSVLGGLQVRVYLPL